MFDPTSPRWRRVRGGFFAAVSAELAALGHLVGGGELPHPSTVLAAGALIGLGAAGLGRRRRGFWSILGMLAVSQVLFHELFSLSAHTGQLDMVRMMAFHLMAAVLSAVALTGGERALFRCAALWRRVIRRLSAATPAVAVPLRWTVQRPPHLPRQRGYGARAGPARPTDLAPSLIPDGSPSPRAAHRQLAAGSSRAPNSRRRSAMEQEPNMKLSSKLARLLAVGVLTTATMAIGDGVASAHVTVSPSSAAAGSYTVITFRVPNESESAGTVGLAVHFPTDTPLASVRYQNVPGWTAKAVTEKLPTPVTEGKITIDQAVTSVTFTADKGNRLAPGEFGQFNLSVGPLPDVASLALPADQTYDDGSVVKWADKTVEGAADPDHPAPVLTLSATGDAQSPAGGPSVQANAHSGSSAATATGSDSTARVLGVIGIVLAALALLLGAVGLGRRSARRPGPAGGSPATSAPVASRPSQAGPLAAAPTATDQEGERG